MKIDEKSLDKIEEVLKRKPFKGMLLEEDFDDEPEIDDLMEKYLVEKRYREEEYWDCLLEKGVEL